MKYKTAIVGTVGIPASYGGFETLAENLVEFHERKKLPGNLIVYCSSKDCPSRPDTHSGAELAYVNLSANGPVSVLYDAISLLSAVRRRCDVILLLGVSGAFALPLVRALSRATIITNVDGVEWKREKWKGFARWWLKKSERWAVRFSHHVVADNGGIAAHVAAMYEEDCKVIAYGGDHAVQVSARPYKGAQLPQAYALALCRIEPENNVAMILEAFSRSVTPLVFIGNWDKSDYGRRLKEQYEKDPSITLLDPIYDVGILRSIRANASIYVHGHSAGGTNPSLVEMMHFGLPVYAYDCTYNRFTTEDRAMFFSTARELREAIQSQNVGMLDRVGTDMLQIARDKYTWEKIGQRYFDLIYAAKEF